MDNCALTDENVINVVSNNDGQTVQSLETLDLSNNFLGA